MNEEKKELKQFDKVRAHQRFDKSPFIEDRLVCGINSLIEELNLSLEKLQSANRAAMASKLEELSPYDKNIYLSLTCQSVKFQVLVEVLSQDNQELIERILSTCERKFLYFLKTGKYNEDEPVH